jgi:hypothetical protein
MSENKNSQLLKVTLVIYAVVCVVYGLGYMFVSDFLVKISGSGPVFHGWLRWSGGVLVALGIGAFLVYRKPEGQGIFVTTIALGSTLCALALFCAWATHEEGAHLWFTALPAIIVSILAILLWWSRQKAKDILYPE